VSCISYLMSYRYCSLLDCAAVPTVVPTVVVTSLALRQSPFVVHLWCRENRSCILTVITVTTVSFVVHFNFLKDYIAWDISRVATLELKIPSYKGECDMRVSVLVLATLRSEHSLSRMVLNPLLPREIS
jgi:hypothetical protein